MSIKNVYMVNKIILFLILCLIIESKSFLFCQEFELSELRSNKSLTYSTATSSKNQGLIATLKYPSNFTPSEHNHPNTIQIFSNQKEYFLYAIAISNKDILLDSSSIAEKSLKELVLSASPKAKFLKYKKGFLIDGHPSAYLEFSTIISDDFFAYCRYYFVLSENFLVGINFTIAQKDFESKNQLLDRFKKYNTFFKEFSNTLIINSR